MKELFSLIRESYSSLWRVKVLGESLEIVTPMVTTNDMFVSVFITKRGDDYVVTDGGWVSLGYYDNEVEARGHAYQKLFQYYIDSYDIMQLIGHGRTFYYKKAKEPRMVVNAVFELSNFISGVVSGSNIQFFTDKKEGSFRKTVHDYLSSSFEESAFEYGIKLSKNSTIEYGAMSHFNGNTQLLNFVTGSTPAYFRDSLCRSNFYFEAAKNYANKMRINKTIAVLDDSVASVFKSPSVQELFSISANRSDNILIPWGERSRLNEILVA